MCNVPKIYGILQFAKHFHIHHLIWTSQGQDHQNWKQEEKSKVNAIFLYK